LLLSPHLLLISYLSPTSPNLSSHRPQLLLLLSASTSSPPPLGIDRCDLGGPATETAVTTTTCEGLGPQIPARDGRGNGGSGCCRVADDGSGRGTGA
ncbi:Os03g0372950, partial [Oryza sativa Japonica Group]